MANGYVKSLQKAIDIIDCLAANGEMGVTDISKQFNISKSSVYNILNTFLQNGWVEKNPVNDKYRLGLHIFELGNVVRAGFKLREIAIPFMKELVNKTGETVHLTIFDDGDVVYIESAQPENKLSIASVAGRRAHVHCTGVGKAILAFQSTEVIEEIIAKKGLPRFTSNTITDPVRLKEHLAEIRKQGYAVDNIEHEQGVKCVAAPIYNERGEVFASMSVTGPSPRFPDKKIEEYALIIKEITANISRRLGWSGEHNGQKGVVDEIIESN